MCKSLRIFNANCFAALFLITSFLVTSSLVAQIPNYVPTNGLVGYWPFNGNANDESGNGNHGTVNGATLTADRNGNANSAFNFDGISQYIVCNSININSQYTVQAWIRASNSIITSESATNSNSGATYISQGSSNYPCNYADFALGLKSGPYFSGSVNCGNIYYNFEQGNNCTFQMKAQCDPIFTEFDQWISVTYVCANNSLAFFKNGILQWEISGMSNLNNSGFPLSFGCRLVPNSGDNAYGWWKGQIDDIAIYNRALTQEEITALYNGTTSTPIAGCTNTTACNYNASATQDDGSCTFPTQSYLNCAGTCINDADNDGTCDELESPTLPYYLPSNGLVGYWPFNGNANDESGNGNHGTVNGATLTNDRNGNANGAYAFQGANQHILIGENLNNGSEIGYPNTSWSLNLWFLNDGSNQLIFFSDYNSIAGNTNNGENDLILSLHNQFFDNSVFSSIRNFPFGDFGCDGIVPNIDSWKMYSCIYSQSTISIYINGTPLCSSSFNNALNYNENPVYRIGSSMWNGNYSQSYGLLDDIAIYNRALTPAEITALYNGTTIGGGGGNGGTAGTPAPSVPQGIPYQAMIRDNNGAAMVNTPVTVRFSLRQDAIDGTVEYQETHNLTTNAFGLVNTHFGSGTATQGTFANINWSNTTKFIQVEANSGSGFVEMGTQQMMSVPFALKANDANKANKIQNAGLPVFANNAAALAGGLVAGEMYRTAAGALMVVY